MGQSSAYGKEFAGNFGLEDAPVVITNILRKAQIAVTEVRSDRPRVGVTDSIPREDAFLVGLQLRDYPQHQMFEDGRAATVCDVRAGETLLYDLKRDPVVMIDKPFHSVHFYIPRAAFNAIADDVNAPRVGDLAYRPGVGVADSTILHLGHSLLATFAHPERASRLFVDHVTLAVATHVAQLYGHLKPVARLVRGGLAPWQVRRSKEILSANLDGSVTMKEVAQECGLSVSHFARAFAVTVGYPPHAWLIKRRLDRAKSMLPDGSLLLSDIALACGFADQSHFTRTFTREVGSSPGLWRRCMKG